MNNREVSFGFFASICLYLITLSQCSMAHDLSDIRKHVEQSQPKDHTNG